MTGIDEAQARWQQVRAKGRTRLIIVLVVAIVILAAIAIIAQGSAGIVVGVVIGVLVVAAAIYLMVSKQKTGLSLTPEWAPKDRGRDEDDDEASGAAPAAPAEPAEPVEPIRKVDAQVLGVDLVSLGQQIGPKLQSSYALGDLHVDGGKVSWVPSSISGGQGAQPLEAAPGEVSVIERVPLWGSWALLRLERSDAAEWCFRIPSSVDLSPALSELGLTLH